MMTSRASLVCISRTTHAGGEEIARRVAAALGLRYVDDEIIAMVAERAGVDEATVTDVEYPKPLMARLADAIDDFGERVTTPSAWFSRPSTEEIRDLIRQVVLEVAERGQAVVVAHAASIAVGQRPGVLRVLVTASPAVRAARLRAAQLFPDDECEARVVESDRERLEYLRRFYDVDEETPLHYDLVINTDQLSVEQAAALIVAAGRG